MSELQKGIDQKKLTTAYHETAHAVMALICGLRIRRISIKGTENYHGVMSTEPFERHITNPVEALREVRISLAGFIGEVIISGKYSIFATHSDVTSAVGLVEDMLEFDDEFKKVVAQLAVSNPGTLAFIESPLIRAYIEGKLSWCLTTLNPYRPVIQSIAQELYKKEELTGEEVSALFNAFTQSSRQPRSSLNGVMRVIENYEICYPNPLNLKVGDKIQLIHKDGPEKWRDWKWCKDSTGNEGWISESYFKPDSESEATIVKDYHAKEVAVQKDETVDLLFTDCGWSWCRKADGDEGWLPTEILK